MTERKTYNKLVRDRIPTIIAAEDRQYSAEVMSEGEYCQALLAKLVEEAQEVAGAESSDMAKELADLYEVINAVMIAFHLNKDIILATQKKRRAERGGFAQRIKLLWAD